MLKISAVYLIGNPEIPIHYTSLSQVEQALLEYCSVRTKKSLYNLFFSLLNFMNFFGSKLIVSCSIGDTCLHDFYIMNLPLTIQNSDGFSQRFNFRKSFATLKYYTFFYSCLACLGQFGQHEQLMTKGGKQIAAGRCYNAERELEKHNGVKCLYVLL